MVLLFDAMVIPVLQYTLLEVVRDLTIPSDLIRVIGPRDCLRENDGPAALHVSPDHALGQLDVIQALRAIV